MSRNKYPEITEKRILNTAARLFLEKGWEQTTIQDIVNELGDLTRGAFYHHFKSKEDVIDAVLERTNLENDPFKKVQTLSELNGLEKLRKAFLLSLEDAEQMAAAKSIPIILTEPKFIAKQLKNSVRVISKDILILIEEGMKDGSICVHFPEQTAETYALLTNIWLSPILFFVSLEEYLCKMKHLQELYASIGLHVIDETVLEKVKQFYIHFYQRWS